MNGPTVLHVVESWRPITTGYTSRGWHIVSEQASGGVARPRVLVSSRQHVYGCSTVHSPPDVSVSVVPPSPVEKRWRRLRRWHVDRLAMANAITQAAQSADLIHVHWASGIGAAAADAAHRLGLPLIAEVRFDLAGAVSSETLPLPLTLERALRGRFEAHLSRATRIVAASHSLARLLRQEFPELSDRVDVVPNGIVPVLRTTRAPHTGPIILGTTANMLRYEGLERLVEAARGLSNIQLLFVGDGRQRKRLERRTAGLDVRFTGRVSPEAVPKLLAEMDVFVVPRLDVTITRFASPIKVVEAMAAGLPVVASAVGDIGDLLADGRGIAVHPGDGTALRAALSDLAANPTRRHAIGDRAAQWVATELPWSQVVERYAPIYASAMSAA